MDRLELKKQICDHLLQITGIKPSDVISVTSDESNIYINVKPNKSIIVVITEEETHDRSIDYEFEY